MRDNHGFDNGLAELVYSFSDMKKVSPYTSTETQKLVAEYQEFYNKHYYECNNELFCALGRMYADDEFKSKIDLFGEGTAEYMSKAIVYYCENKIKSE